jgi:hypothetical protein
MLFLAGLTHGIGMNWDAIGALGELVGAIAVVISVLYLAGQVRSQVRETKLNAIHEVSHGFREGIAATFLDKQLAELFVAAKDDPGEARPRRSGSSSSRSSSATTASGRTPSTSARQGSVSMSRTGGPWSGSTLRSSLGRASSGFGISAGTSTRRSSPRTWTDWSPGRTPSSGPGARQLSGPLLWWCVRSSRRSPERPPDPTCRTPPRPPSPRPSPSYRGSG